MNKLRIRLQLLWRALRGKSIIYGCKFRHLDIVGEDVYLANNRQIDINVK